MVVGAHEFNGVLLLAALGVEYMFQGANEWVSMYWGVTSMLV